MNTDGLTFSFDSYELLDPRTLAFHYSYRDGQSRAIASFAETYKLLVEINSEDAIANYILQQLHIIVGVSYYKSLLGPITLPYELNDSEASYWNTVYSEGLGEYAYLNKISVPITPFAPSEQAIPNHQ